MSDYSNEAYEAEECGKYRQMFPTETKGLSDEALFDLTRETTDDMDAAGWQALFETRGKINLSIIRDAFQDAKDRDLRLSDELLVAVIKRAGKTWTEFTDNEDSDGAIAFLEKAETTAAQVSITDPGISALVKKMDTAFHDAIKDDVEAVVKGKTTAVRTYASFKRIYTLEEMNRMPIPGTEAEQVTGNQRPDKVKTKDQTGKPITVTWSNDFVSAMPEGKEYEGILDNIAKEVKSPGSVPALKGKSKQSLAALKSDATTRRNALRSMVKKAISLHHQWEAVRGMPLVGFNWIPGTKEKHSAIIPEQFGEGTEGDKPTIVTVAPRSIWMYPANEPANGRDFSVTQFLAFDVPAAIAAGGTMAELVATAGRGSDDTADGDGDGEDMAEDQAMATMSMVVNYLNKRENVANVLRIIADKKHSDHNDWIENIGDLYVALHPIVRKTRNQYEALKETKLEGFEDKAVA